MDIAHRLATPYADRPVFGRSLDECSECGNLVDFPRVAICARGDLCIVCSDECKIAHEASHGYGSCFDCVDDECQPHRAESDAVFAARDLAKPAGRWHCAWSSCSRLFIKADKRYSYCGRPDCPATRQVPEYAQPADELLDAMSDAAHQRDLAAREQERAAIAAWEDAAYADQRSHGWAGTDDLMDDGDTDAQLDWYAVPATAPEGASTMVSESDLSILRFGQVPNVIITDDVAPSPAHSAIVPSATAGSGRTTSPTHHRSLTMGTGWWRCAWHAPMDWSGTGKRLIAVPNGPPFAVDSRASGHHQ